MDFLTAYQPVFVAGIGMMMTLRLLQAADQLSFLSVAGIDMYVLRIFAN